MITTHLTNLRKYRTKSEYKQQFPKFFEIYKIANIYEYSIHIKIGIFLFIISLH